MNARLIQGAGNWQDGEMCRTQLDHPARHQEADECKIESIREPLQAACQVKVTLRQREPVLRVDPMRPGIRDS